MQLLINWITVTETNISVSIAHIKMTPTIEEVLLFLDQLVKEMEWRNEH